MRAFGSLTALVLLSAAALKADMRQVLKVTVNGRSVISKEYVQADSFRSEDSSGNHITIWNRNRKVMYQVDGKRREYVVREMRGPDLLLALAQWIARPPRIRQSGKTLNIYFETVDTGERRQFLGRTAQHILLRERQVPEPGACGTAYESERDEWVIPDLELGSGKPHAHLVGYFGLVGSQTCQDTIVRHGQPPLGGLAVLVKDGRFTREILEYSNAPLDRSLFDAPSGFKKVDALWGQPAESWPERMTMEWDQLCLAIESWFN